MTEIRNDATREVVLLDLDDLIENPKNPRKHSDSLIESLSRQFLKGVGYRDPIEVDELNMILAGHGRKKALLAVRDLGKLNEVRGTVNGAIPVIRYLDLSEKEKLAYLLAANKEQEKSEWDTVKLKDLLDSPVGLELKNDDIRLSGFGAAGLTQLFRDVSGKTEGQEEGEEKEGKTYGDKPKETELPPEEMAKDFVEWLCGFTEIFAFFSGGKDSMAMIGELLDLGVDRKKITLVHAKTPLDYPDLHELVDKFAADVGLRLERIGKEFTDEERWAMFRAYGFPRHYPRWCTGAWKISEQKKFFKEREVRKRDDVVMAVGWRAEEAEYRAAASNRAIDNTQGVRIARPILHFTEDDVWAKIKKYGWEAHYSYDYRPRLSCVFCGMIQREEWVAMREKDPESFFFALRVLAEGMCSPVLDEEAKVDTLRKMLGLGTMAAALKEDGDNKWQKTVKDRLKKQSMKLLS